MTSLVWCEVDVSALAANATALKACAPDSRLGCVVKSDAYGHGILLAARAFLRGGADWIIVQSVEEARALRSGGIEAPLLIIGYVPPWAVEEARALGCRLVVYNSEVLDALDALAPGPPLSLHIKVETGNHRQGLPLSEALALARRIQRSPGACLEGLSSHFANVEDTTDHSYARLQLSRFDEALETFRAAGFEVPIPHIANSAATLLWPEAHHGLCRAGLIAYGMWPSPETLVSTVLGKRPPVPVRPALTWKSRVVQLKEVPAGGFIGYGCTYMATHRSRIAVVPVGYYEGYDRGLSNLAYVLIRGQRAPLRGRVCMNFIMVDVTDVPEVALHDEVVLLGSQGGQALTAEQLGAWIGTINYEITTRIAGHIPRVAVGEVPPELAGGERLHEGDERASR